MSDLIQNTINSVLSDGARPTKFRVQLILPTTFGPEENKLDVIAKTVSFPSKFNDPIFLKHKGRQIPIQGQEKFTHVVDITFYLDEEHEHKKMFETWMQGLNYDTYAEKQDKHYHNLKKLQTPKKSPANVSHTSMVVEQLDFEGENPKAKYTFNGLFPKEVSQVQMDASQVSSILEFTVTFMFSTYEFESLDGGKTSSDIANSILGDIQGKAGDLINKAMGFIPGLDSLNTGAASANTSIQEAGKSVSAGFDDFFNINTPPGK